MVYLLVSWPFTKSFPFLFSIFEAFFWCNFSFNFFSGTSWNAVPILVDFRYSFVGRKVYFCPRKFPKREQFPRTPGSIRVFRWSAGSTLSGRPFWPHVSLGESPHLARHSCSSWNIRARNYWVGFLFFLILNITPKLFFLQLWTEDLTFVKQGKIGILQY